MRTTQEDIRNKVGILLLIISGQQMDMFVILWDRFKSVPIQNFPCLTSRSYFKL